MNQSPFLRPILVTGSHRSGTTWVGRMIATSRSIGYIHEPFNIIHRPGICGAPFDYWYTYICDQNSALYYNDLKNCVEFKYQFAKELRAIKSLDDVARFFRDSSHFSYCKYLKKRPLVKDPLAFFSAEWLAKTFNMDVVVLIRHPAGFASSLKKVKQEHPFGHFLQQPLLMREHLSDFEAEIEEFTKNKHDVVDQAIVLWNTIHSVALKYQRKHPEWIFVRHKDLCDNPVSEFSNLFARLNLDFSESVQKDIIKFSDAGNPTEPESAGTIRRNSRETRWNWKNRLTEEEIGRIREGTRAIADHFFSDQEWSVDSVTPKPVNADDVSSLCRAAVK